MDADVVPLPPVTTALSLEQSAAAVLNDFFKLDPEACSKLIEYRVATKAAVADHPTIVVDASGEKAKVGMVGLLNGILNKFNPTGERVAIMYDGPKVVGFTIYKP